MTPNRTISKKLRFEIFKRDSFKCQYCGKSAPDVLLDLKELEIDHIVPVCKNGETNIMNLVTACFDCNRGKSGNLLSQNLVLEKQRKQLEELEERRKQIELMMEWHQSLQEVDVLTLNKVTIYLNEKISVDNRSLSNIGINNLKKAIRNYELSEILSAIDSSFDYYYNKSFDKNVTFNLFMKKLPGVLRNRRREKTDPEYSFLLEIFNCNKRENNWDFTFKSIEKLYKRLKD